MVSIDSVGIFTLSILHEKWYKQSPMYLFRQRYIYLWHLFYLAKYPLSNLWTFCPQGDFPDLFSNAGKPPFFLIGQAAVFQPCLLAEKQDELLCPAPLKLRHFL